MPVDLLSYNPGTHRVRVQRTLDPARDKELDDDPFGPGSQAYLHQLLMGDPADPTEIDPAFEGLKDDLAEHGQSEPGIITRSGVLINGNTRRAALKVIGAEHIRVGVLDPDASHTDLDSIELSLQLRKPHKREYSFMNSLIALDERVAAGRPTAEIVKDFRIKEKTFNRHRWILAFVRETIERSKVTVAGGTEVSMRLVDFESHQGKLEELYRAYTALKAKSPDDAEALREQRLLALVFGTSKTDMRFIEADFADIYMPGVIPPAGTTAAPVAIPGTSITVAPASPKVESLKAMTDEALRARAVELAPSAAPPEALAKAEASLKKFETALESGLDKAGKYGRVIKKKYAPVDRLSDANESLGLALGAVADARATGNFDPEDLEDILVDLKKTVGKLAQQVVRGTASSGEGIAWLRAAATTPPGTGT